MKIRAPATIMRFRKSPFTSRTNRGKIFSATLTFSFCFYLFILVRFHSKTRILFDAHSPIVRVKTPENADESDSTLYITLFSSPFSKSSVFVSVFGCLAWTIAKNAESTRSLSSNWTKTYTVPRSFTSNRKLLYDCNNHMRKLQIPTSYTTVIYIFSTKSFLATPNN